MIQFNKLSIDSNNLYIDVQVKEDSYYKNVYLDRLYIDNQDSFIQSGPSSKAYSLPLVTNNLNFVIKVTNNDLDVINENLYYYNGKMLEGYYYDFSGLALSDTFEGEDVIIDFTQAGYESDYNVSSLKGKVFYYLNNNLTDLFPPLNKIKLTLDTTRLPYDLSKDLFFVYVKTKGIPTADTPCGKDNEITLGVVYNNKILYQSSISYLKELNDECSIPKNFIDFILKNKAFEMALKTGHYDTAIKYWNAFIKIT